MLNALELLMLTLQPLAHTALHRLVALSTDLLQPLARTALHQLVALSTDLLQPLARTALHQLVALSTEQVSMETWLTQQADTTTTITTEITGSTVSFLPTTPSLPLTVLLALQFSPRSETPRMSSAILRATSSASLKSPPP